MNRLGFEPHIDTTTESPDTKGNSDREENWKDNVDSGLTTMGCLDSGIGAILLLPVILADIFFLVLSLELVLCVEL